MLCEALLFVVIADDWSALNDLGHSILNRITQLLQNKKDGSI
jgi:hypothetical protein